MDASRDTDHPLVAVLETALDAVIVMDSAGSIKHWNEVALETFGWSRDEAVGRLLSELIIPHRFRDAHRRGLDTYLRTGVGPVLGRRIEVTALRKTGEEFPVELSITPYNDGTGPVFLGFLRDITVRKQVAARLERQALQATLLYDTISFAAQADTFEAALRKCLEAFLELTGWPIGHVYLPSDDDPGILVPSNIWHPADDDRYTSLKAVTAKTRFTPGEGLPGHVLLTGEPVWIADVCSDARFLRSKQVKELDITSALGLPIKNASAVVGVIELFSPVRAEPENELVLSLRSIGDQVGHVFERRLAEMKLHRQSQHQKLLLAELNHRVKNMLAVVTGIATQTMRNSNSMQEFNKSFLERLQALSQAHSLLASQNWGPTSLEDLITQALAPYESPTGQISVAGPNVLLLPKAALAMSLVFHELVTNAAKYGALAQPRGRLSVSWRISDEDNSRVNIAWNESGLCNVARPSKTGFGTRLIDATVTREMHGKLLSCYQSDGVRYELDLLIAPAINCKTTIGLEGPDDGAW